MKKIVLIALFLFQAACPDETSVRDCLPRCYYTRQYIETKRTRQDYGALKTQLFAFCRNRSQDIELERDLADAGFDERITQNNLPKCESYLIH